MEFKSTELKTPMENALELKEVDVDTFFCESIQLWRPLNARGVFGGQVIGLALTAATKTVNEEFRIHSLHCHFLLSGNNLLPIVYHVNRIRDGNSFVSRHVEARQEDKLIFSCIASFQVLENSELEHQYTMPNVPGPESVRSVEQILSELLDNPKVPVHFHSTIRMKLSEPILVDLKRINPKAISLQDSPKQMVWMKAKEKLPEILSIHQSVLAYCSDHYLLNTTLLIHNLKKTKRKLKMIASLDHAIWFHSEEFRADEWLLYEMESPRTIGGRGFALGRIYTQEGKLVASTAQEGVIRIKSKI